MKIRTGFVSNSSSSSFIIQKKNLSKEQINMIYNHIEYAKILAKMSPNLKDYFEYASDDNHWDVEEKENTILVSTFMDNFDMSKFLKVINIDKNDIEYNDY